MSNSNPTRNLLLEALPPLPEQACRGCDGSGTIRAMTSHLGPDDYEFDQCCPACQGTGSADLRDAINALGYWTHKTDVERIVIERSAVLRIISARAAIAQSQQAAPSAQAEPIGTFEGRYVCPEGTREFRGLLADGVEPPKPGTKLYAAPPAAQAEPQVPLTDEQIVMDGLMMTPTKTLESCADAFTAGVRFAERAHRIGKQEPHS